MTQSTVYSDIHLSTSVAERGELFSVLLRLHPLQAGLVMPGAGTQMQTAFLDMVRQANPALSDWLHTPNQRRPYTVGLLQGFNHLSAAQLDEARIRQQTLAVQPGQTYWLRITMLDATIFGSFAQYLIAKARTVIVRIGEAQFEISRLLATPEADANAQSLVAYSSFVDLHTLLPAQKQYRFEFMSPTAFSKGQKLWGKQLQLFPEPHTVFESLARQWELFAPEHVRMATSDLSLRSFVSWCEENIVVARYKLETSYLPSSKFGQAGFQGTVTYEVKGLPTTIEARWLSPLAHLALFSGVGYKTTIGMGQIRCTNLIGSVLSDEKGRAE